jgi:hypothetical protein
LEGVCKGEGRGEGEREEGAITGFLKRSRDERGEGWLNLGEG